MPKKTQQDYYNQIDRALKCYEEHKPWYDLNIYSICDRIDWCHKWKKISQEQSDELADRAVKVMENMG